MCGISTSQDTLEPAAPLASSLVGRLVHLFLLTSVAVLPALHQHDQGVEPEEDDDGDDDPLQDDPDVGVLRSGHQPVVSQLLDGCCRVLKTERVRKPHHEVEQD